jgi:hypothetical protein
MTIIQGDEDSEYQLDHHGQKFHRPFPSNLIPKFKVQHFVIVVTLPLALQLTSVMAHHNPDVNTTV